MLFTFLISKATVYVRYRRLDRYCCNLVANGDEINKSKREIAKKSDRQKKAKLKTWLKNTFK